MPTITKILNAIFLVGVLSALIYFVHREQIIYLIVSTCGIALMINYLMIKPKKYIYIILFLILFTVLYLMNFFYYQSTGNLRLYALLGSQLGFGMFLLENNNGLKSIRLVYIFICVILIYYLLKGVSLQDISEASSANIVNFIFLAFSILLMAIYYKRNNKMIVIPSILSVVVSILTLGRSGIITSIILLIGTVILKYKHKLSKVTIGILLIILPFFGYYILNFIENLVYNIIYRSGERTTIVEGSPRLEIIYAYLRDLDISKVIFGYDYKSYVFSGYTNLHNSYLDVHYNFGLAGIVIVMILLGILIYYIVSKQYFYFILMTSLMLRIATDTVALVWIFDFGLIFLVLICVEQFSNRKNLINLYKSRRKESPI